MVSYFFTWTPVVIVLGTLVLLTNAYLVLIALMLVALAALAALAWAMSHCRTCSVAPSIAVGKAAVSLSPPTAAL
jgi:hypothetical protein